MSGLRYPCSQGRLRGDGDGYSAFEMPNRLLKIILDDDHYVIFFGGGDIIKPITVSILEDVCLKKKNFSIIFIIYLKYPKIFRHNEALNGIF